jgi:hypothetical protein
VVYQTLLSFSYGTPPMEVYHILSQEIPQSAPNVDS